jgi:hypothetical protein
VDPRFGNGRIFDKTDEMVEDLSDCGVAIIRPTRNKMSSQALRGDGESLSPLAKKLGCRWLQTSLQPAPNAVNAPLELPLVLSAIHRWSHTARIFISGDPKVETREQIAPRTSPKLGGRYGTTYCGEENLGATTKRLLPRRFFLFVRHSLFVFQV